MQWYIINTMAGSEGRIKNEIISKAGAQNLSDSFKDIVIPSISVDEVKKGKTQKVEKKMTPGYVMIQMEMNDVTWGLIRSINKVSKFLGSADKPKPVPESEINSMIGQLKQQEENYNKGAKFSPGGSVEILEGPFESFVAIIDEVCDKSEILKVSVPIFGRNTIIELSFSQVKVATGKKKS